MNSLEGDETMFTSDLQFLFISLALNVLFLFQMYTWW